MKTKYIFASSLLLSLAFTGCQDLDTAPEGDTVTTDQKEEVYIQNPERAEAAINAIYSQFNQRTPNANALGTERHNDIGYPTIMLCTDANGMDVVSDNNGYSIRKPITLLSKCIWDVLTLPAPFVISTWLSCISLRM